MSTQSNLKLLSPVLSTIKPASLTLGPSIDNQLNRYTISLAYQGFIAMTSDLLLLQGRSCDSVIVRLTRLSKFLLKTDVNTVLTLSKKGYDLWLDIISQKIDLVSYMQFKAALTQEFDNEIVSDFLSPINPLLSTTLVGNRLAYKTSTGCWASDNVQNVRNIAQYFGFLMKLPVSNTDLELQAIRDYVDFEENYPESTYSEKELQAVSGYLAEQLSSFVYDGSLCHHGEGAVADCHPPTKFFKYHCLSSDTRLEKAFELHSSSFSDYAPLGVSTKPLKRISKLIMVPKNVTKLRSISMEPTSLQYVQQGVKDALYDYIKNHKVLSRHIKLEDQFQNQSLAYDGSISNKYATIDSSAASDSVSWENVKKLFSKLPEILNWLYATRSTHTKLPDGTILHLKKFAPMGSALCFPIETLVFAAIAKVAVDTANQKGLISDVNDGVSNHFFSIYGDDVIVPTEAYHETVTLLRKFGFTVNDSKSYADSPFKESCGGNYYCGVDITPIKWNCEIKEPHMASGDQNSYYRSPLEAVAELPELSMALCGKANLAYAHQFKVLRCFIIRVLLDAKVYPIFVNHCDPLDAAPYIFSPTPTNFHLPDTYNYDLQKGEKFYGSCGNRYRTSECNYCTDSNNNTHLYADNESSRNDAEQVILYYESLSRPMLNWSANNHSKRHKLYIQKQHNRAFTNGLSHKVGTRHVITDTNPLSLDYRSLHRGSLAFQVSTHDMNFFYQ